MFSKVIIGLLSPIITFPIMIKIKLALVVTKIAIFVAAELGF